MRAPVLQLAVGAAVLLGNTSSAFCLPGLPGLRARRQRGDSLSEFTSPAGFARGSLGDELAPSFEAPEKRKRNWKLSRNFPWFQKRTETSLDLDSATGKVLTRGGYWIGAYVLVSTFLINVVARHKADIILWFAEHPRLIWRLPNKIVVKASKWLVFLKEKPLSEVSESAVSPDSSSTSAGRPSSNTEELTLATEKKKRSGFLWLGGNA